MSDLSDVLADCRDRFKGRRNLLRADLRKPSAPGAEEQIPGSLKAYYEMLLDWGKIVWAVVAQANGRLFAAGSDDLPGVTVYSPDPYFDNHPQDLRDIATAAYLLKGTEPEDAELRAVADRMTNEYDMTARQPLPSSLTGGRVVYIAVTLFHRGRLPGRVLAARLVPVVVGMQYTDVNMVLPLLCWSNELRAAWPTLDEQLAALPVTSTATQVARAAQRWRVRTEEPWADTPPIRVSPRAAQVFRDIVAEFGLPEPAYLCLSLRADGSKHISTAESYDPKTERCFAVAGVLVVVRLDQLRELQGSLIDYQEGVFGTGFVVRLAGE